MDTNRRSFHIDRDGQWREGPRQEGISKALTVKTTAHGDLTPVRAAALGHTAKPALQSAPKEAAALSEKGARAYAAPVRRNRVLRRRRRGFFSFARLRDLMPARWPSRRSRTSLRLGDMAVFGMAGGLAVAAIVMTLVHNIDAQATQASGLDRTPPTWIVESQHTGRQIGVVLNDAPLTHLSAESDVLVFPRFTSLMYEGGVFDTYQHAVATAADYAHSGVASYPVQADGVTTLLLGPTLNPKRDQSFIHFLNQQQVPYFVRSFSTPQWSVPVPGLPAATDAHLEGLITSDLQVLQGLLALHAGYAVPQLSAWAAEGSYDDQLVLPLLGTQLGAMGSQIAAFHASVLACEEALQGRGASEGDRAMRALTKAITLYLQIGQS